MALGQSLINPFISTPGGGARHRYLSDDIVGVDWLANETQLANLGNVTTEFNVRITFAEGFGGELLLTNLPVEYNMTRISCVPHTDTGPLQDINCTSLLLLQGIAS